MSNLTKEQNKEIAATILSQLGGNKFLAMTGAKNLAYGEASLSMKLTKNKIGATHLVIKLTSMDDYTMTFSRCTIKANKVLKQIEGLYFDQLQEFFTDVTGLDTRMV